MRVLWFTNTPSLASEVLNDKNNIGGWIASLEKEVYKSEEVELSVAFHFGYSEKRQFNIEKTKYFSFPFRVLSKGHRMGTFSRWKHKIEPAADVNFYLEIIEQFKPDIIHIFGTEQAFGLIIDEVDVPVVIQIQGNLSVCEKKWFSGLSSCEILLHSKIKTILYAYGIWHQTFALKKRAKRERILMRNCKYIIGRTDWDRRISKILSPSSKYYHCEELLRNEFYLTKRWQKPVEEKIRLVTTISTMAYKGLEAILETSQLLKQNSFFEYEWIIAGIKGTEEIVRIIESTYKLRFADQNISFRGSLSAEKLISELSQAHIYIHPSHIENSPNSVCEAMILGMPVIATYAGGTPSIVSNGVDGLLVQDGDPYAMAGAILELVQDNELMLSLADNAYNTAIVRHNKKDVSEGLVEIYKKIIAENNIEI